jgi:hypothetical protein
MRRVDTPRTDFASQAEGAQSSSLGELILFLRDNKKWWLTPIVLVLLLVGGLIVLGGTAAAPFIYTIF